MGQENVSFDGFIPTEHFYSDRKDKTLAVISFVVSIFSVLTLGFAGLGALLGLLLGIIALAKITRNPSRFAGRGLAIGAILLSSLSAVLFCLVVYAFTQSFLPSTPVYQAEEAAVSRMRGISRSEETYRRYVSNGRYGTLEELHAKGLIDHGETKDGYTFAVTIQDKTFTANAVPNKYGLTGRRSFYVTTDGVLRAADKKGAIAERSDPPLR